MSEPGIRLFCGRQTNKKRGEENGNFSRGVKASLALTVDKRGWNGPLCPVDVTGRSNWYEGVTVKRIILTTALALTVSACSITPKPLTTGAVKSFADDKLARVTAQQEPVTQGITIHEAMARALKYNLDFHVEVFNEALAARKLDTARLDTLPKLAASALYSGRNNESGGRSSVLFPDREKFQEDISLSWNILDFGLSYVRAQQAADEVLVAEENRRKIINGNRLPTCKLSAVGSNPAYTVRIPSLSQPCI